MYRAKTLEIYRLLLRGAPILMPTKAAREFWLARVKSEFRLHKHETDPKRIEQELYRAYNILITASENHQKNIKS
jgi:hypothetical protein